MHTVLNPNFFSVPQLAQTELEGNLANFLTFCSAGVNDMVISAYNKRRRSSCTMVAQMLFAWSLGHRRSASNCPAPEREAVEFFFNGNMPVSHELSHERIVPGWRAAKHMKP